MRDAVMRYTNKAEAKITAEPNHSALQHAGLAAILVLVILFSAIEMARTAMSRAATMPEIVQMN
jgi:hypothetical protein